MDEPRAILASPTRPIRVTDAADAFARLIEGQLDGAYRLAGVILGSALEAEDAVADALPVPATRPNGIMGGGFSAITTVDLVYDQLSFVHTHAVVLRDAVNVWWPDQCPSDLASPSPSPKP
jgi:hypothetical protein